MFYAIYMPIYVMCPACDVTAWVTCEQQYPGPGKGPYTGIYVDPGRFGIKTYNLKYILVIL